MRIRLAGCLLGIASIAGCGGGDGGSSPPPDPQFQILASTLASTGISPTNVYPALPTGHAVANSRDEYRQVILGRGGNSYDLAIADGVDFTSQSLVYIEGNAGEYTGSVVRIDQVTRTNGNDRIIAERCTVANDTGTQWRPYAIYVTAKISPQTPINWATRTASCTTVSPVELTFVVDFQFNAGNGRPQPPPATPIAIRTQAQLDALLPSIPASAVPPAYRAPDFSKVTLLFISGWGDWDVNSYVRAFRAYDNGDGSLDVMVEYCGNSLAGVPFHAPYALYAVERVASPARQNLITHEPGMCVMPR